MSIASSIEWCDSTWNPIVGCSILSPGCTNCYAMSMAARIEAMANGASGSHYDGTTKKVNGHAVWTGKVALAPEHILTAPLRWKKPRRVFVNSMGDLFHESIPDEWIDRVFAVMALCPRHTFQVLTKRAQRMRKYMDRMSLEACGTDAGWAPRRLDQPYSASYMDDVPRPILNIWLGVSAERQQEADERIPLLLQTPAAVRFVSLEPLLGPIDLTTVTFDRSDALSPQVRDAYGTGLLNALTGDKQGHVATSLGGGPRLDWVIVGGESGPNARPFHLKWRKLVSQPGSRTFPRTVAARSPRPGPPMMERRLHS